MLLEIIKQNKGKTGWGVGIRYTESQDKELQKNRIIFCINKQPVERNGFDLFLHVSL